MIRYQLEKLGYQDVGRVIPSDYIFFMGDRKCTNYFINFPHKGSLKTAMDNAWDWSLEDPYYN